MLKLSHDYDLLYYAPVFFFSFGCFNRLTLLLSLSRHCLPLLSRFPGVLMDLMSCFLCWTVGRCSFCTMRTSQLISSVNTTRQSRWPESHSSFMYTLARMGTLLNPPRSRLQLAAITKPTTHAFATRIRSDSLLSVNT